MSVTAPETPSIEDLVARYHAWLRDRTALKKIRHWTEITTPFLDRHNDCIQIYARREESGFLLTDDAHTLNDLEKVRLHPGQAEAARNAAHHAERLWRPAGGGRPATARDGG